MIEWKFNEEIEDLDIDDFYYDITYGGYIKPDELLTDKEQIQKIKDAVEVMESFRRALEERFDFENS